MKVNGIEVETIDRESEIDVEYSGDRLRGPNGVTLINNKMHEIESYDVNYLDLEKSDFIKAIIDGKGDLWKDEWSEKGQRILGEYIIYDNYIRPDDTAKFRIGKYDFLTVILDEYDTSDSSITRKIITHYASSFTERFNDIDYITLEDESILIDTVDINQLYIIPVIIPEDYAEILLDESLTAPPYFTLDGTKYIGQVNSPSIEAIGRGESFEFTAREV